MSRRLSWVVVWLSCVLAGVAVALRFHGLTVQSLWSDELFSVSVLTQVGAGRPWYDYVPKAWPDLRMEDSFLTWKLGEHSPPLFEALLWLWTLVFGWSDFAVRAFSAVLGSLAPLVLFGGLRRPLGVWPAAGAALIFVLSPSAVAYAQEARGYALLMLLASIAVVRLVRYALADGGPRSHWRESFALDVGVYLLLSYTHYTGLVLACDLAVLRFVLAWWQRRPLREFGWIAALPALFAPWLYLHWSAMAAASTGNMGWGNLGWADVWSMLLPKAAQFFLPGRYALPVALVLALLGAGLGAWGRSTADAGGDRRRSPDPRWNVDPRWLVCWAFMAMVIMHFGYGIYTALHVRVWHERYFSAMLPVVMALFALLFSLAGQHRHRSRLSCLSCLFPVCVLLLACVVSIAALRVYYRSYWKEEYREASLYIAQNTRGRPTVVGTWAGNAMFFNYYLRGFMADAGRSYTLATVGKQGDLEDGIAALCQRRRPGEQVVLFQHQMHRLFFDLVNRHCAGALRLVSERQFLHLFVDLYEATGVAPSPSSNP